MPNQKRAQKAQSEPKPLRQDETQLRGKTPGNPPDPHQGGDVPEKKRVRTVDPDLESLREEEKQIRIEIGGLLAEHIKRSGVSRAQLAEKMGYSSPAQISKWITGVAPITADRLAVVADMLRVPVSYLFPERHRSRVWQGELAHAVASNELRSALDILLKQFPATKSDGK